MVVSPWTNPKRPQNETHPDGITGKMLCSLFLVHPAILESGDDTRKRNTTTGSVVREDMANPAGPLVPLEDDVLGVKRGETTPLYRVFRSAQIAALLLASLDTLPNISLRKTRQTKL